MKPRHNEDLIQLGIAMFKKACSDARSTKTPGGLTVWSGSSCKGGGWSEKLSMNEDAMTPKMVARVCDLRSITGPANEAYEAEILKQAKRYIS
jgi:hypothetical protein